MKSIWNLVLAAVLIAAAGAHSAVSAEKASKAAPPKQPGRYLAEPFDEQVDRLPANFRGHDAFALYQAVSKAKPPTKSEFETADDFASRAATWERRQLVGSVSAEGPLALVMSDRSPSILSRYDAEIKKLSLDIHYSRRNVYKSGHSRLQIFAHARRVGSYVATNAFNRRVQVERFARNEFALQVNRGGSPGRYFLEAELEPEVARAEKAHMALLYIGKLIPPYVTAESEREEPTISSPEDVSISRYVLHMDVAKVWLVNTRTGEVLTKYEWR